jgi:hypothetical protein
MRWPDNSSRSLHHFPEPSPLPRGEPLAVKRPNAELQHLTPSTHINHTAVARHPHGLRGAAFSLPCVIQLNRSFLLTGLTHNQLEVASSIAETKNCRMERPPECCATES